MSMKSVYLNVALIKRLPRSLGVLTYAHETDAEPKTLVGRWVRVPFRGTMADGIVWSTTQKPPQNITVQPISAIDESPPLGVAILDFAERFAREYWISIHHALDVMVPERPARGLQEDAIPKNTNKPRVQLRIKKREQQTIAAAVHETLSHDGGRKSFLPLGKFAERVVAMLHVCMTIPAERQVLILVPTHEELLRCQGALAGPLSHRIIVLDTALPKTAYWTAWQSVSQKVGAVVLTTKRGMFAPYRSLGAVVIDQETDRNHRQSEMNPRYDARVVAEWIASQHHAVYIALDAVPTLRTFSSKYIERRTTSPAQGTRHLVDRLMEPRGGYDDILAPRVLDAVKKTEGTALFFVNRRGAARSLFCRDCGWTAACPACGSAFAVADGALACYRCETKDEMPIQCKECQSVHLKTRGMGVQQFARKLQSILPQRQIAVLEGVVTLKTIQPGTLIVATEKVFSVPLLPRLSLIVLTDLDVLLRHPGYATYESVYCLCERICSLGEEDTAVYVQTREPGHPVCKALKEHQPALLYDEEIQTRATLLLPPTATALKLTYRGKNVLASERMVAQCIADLHDDPLIAKAMSIEEVKPSPAQREAKNPHHAIVLRGLSGGDESATLGRVRKLLADAWVIERNPESLTA